MQHSAAADLGLHIFHPFCLNTLGQYCQQRHEYFIALYKRGVYFLSPRFFRKSVGDIVIASVRLSVRYVISSPNHWTESNQIWCEWLAYTSGAVQEHVYFWPHHPRGPGEGSKGQILTISNFKVNFKDFYAKMCTYTQ